MTHPKNSTASTAAQQQICALEQYTVNQTSFWGGGDARDMFQVHLATPSGEALKEASNLLAGTLKLLQILGDSTDGIDANSNFALMFLLESSKALLDAGTYGVEFQRVRGGAQ